MEIVGPFGHPVELQLQEAGRMAVSVPDLELALLVEAVIARLFGRLMLIFDEVSVMRGAVRHSNVLVVRVRQGAIGRVDAPRPQRVDEFVLAQFAD